MTEATETQYSADVRCELCIGDRVIPVAKTGPNYAVLRERHDIACNGEIVFYIGDKVYRRPVFIRFAANTESKTVYLHFEEDRDLDVIE
jgi:hypothetical protein